MQTLGNNRKLIIVAISATLIALAWHFDFGENVGAAASTQIVLEAELRTIALPEDGGSVSLGSYRRPSTAFASASSQGGTYPYDRLASYFDAELARNQWRFVSEEKVLDWWRDLGGHIRRYCKGLLGANLQYAGNPQGDYALTITPGNESSCSKP